jgi:hypothetical protein
MQHGMAASHTPVLEHQIAATHATKDRRFSRQKKQRGPLGSVRGFQDKQAGCCRQNPSSGLPIFLLERWKKLVRGDPEPAELVQEFLGGTEGALVDTLLVHSLQKVQKTLRGLEKRTAPMFQLFGGV